MTNTEILTKAIQKAIDGGWLPGHKLGGVNSYRFDNDKFAETYVAIFNAEDGSGLTNDYKAIIFNHDFAKALWGEDPKTETTYYLGTPKPNTLGLPHPESDTTTETYLWHNWQYHLQQMVIAEDPIKYLGDHL